MQEVSQHQAPHGVVSTPKAAWTALKPGFGVQLCQDTCVPRRRPQQPDFMHLHAWCLQLPKPPIHPSWTRAWLTALKGQRKEYSDSFQVRPHTHVPKGTHVSGGAGPIQASLGKHNMERIGEWTESASSLATSQEAINPLFKLAGVLSPIVRLCAKCGEEMKDHPLTLGDKTKNKSLRQPWVLVGGAEDI